MPVLTEGAHLDASYHDIQDQLTKDMPLSQQYAAVFPAVSSLSMFRLDGGRDWLGYLCDEARIIIRGHGRGKTGGWIKR